MRFLCISGMRRSRSIALDFRPLRAPRPARLHIYLYARRLLMFPTVSESPSWYMVPQPPPWETLELQEVPARLGVGASRREQ